MSTKWIGNNVFRTMQLTWLHWSGRRNTAQPCCNSKLHWLPVANYKVTLLTQIALSDGSEGYLHYLGYYMSTVPQEIFGQLLKTYLSFLHASSNNKTAIAGLTFQNYASKRWNSLSSNLPSFAIQHISNNSVLCFKHTLKTELFTCAIQSWKLKLFIPVGLLLLSGITS